LLDEAGFCSAAKWYVEGFSRRSNIRVRLDLAPIGRLPRLIETAFFRILQESLANIYRHSSSSIADVRTRQNPGGVVLEVEDYGGGIPPQLLNQFEHAGSGTGVGLGGMRERMEDLGGRLEIVSGPSGTLVRAKTTRANSGSGTDNITALKNAVAA
jgi:signal transduction histidine kinase